MSELKSSTIKIALFIDGNYFMHVSKYYRFHHERHSRISFRGLIDYIRKYIAKQEGNINYKFCQCVDAHWFRGKYTMQLINEKSKMDGVVSPTKKLKLLENDRYVDDALMYEGITQHVFPLKRKIDPSGRITTAEKGIDVWLAVEALELAYLKRYDVLALVACDTDYVPLVRKLNGLGIKVMLVSWDVSYTLKNSEVRVVIRTSQQLIDECSYYLNMNREIESRDEYTQREVKDLFYSAQ